MGIQGPGEGYYELIGGLALGASLLVMLALAFLAMRRHRHRRSIMVGALVAAALVLGTYSWAVNRDDTHPLEDALSASIQAMTSRYEPLDGVEPADADPEWIPRDCEADPDGGYLTSAGHADRRIDIEALAPQMEQDGFTVEWTRNLTDDINGLEAHRGDAGVTIRVFTDYSSLHFRHGSCLADP